MARIPAPPLFAYGQHSAALHQAQIIAAEQLFSSASFAAPASHTAVVPSPPRYNSGTHAAAITQMQALLGCAVFPAGQIPTAQFIQIARDFLIAEAEWPGQQPSMVSSATAFIGSQAVQNPLMGPALVTLPQYPLDQVGTYFMAPTTAMIPVPPPVVLRVQATAIGWYDGALAGGDAVLYGPGDVFDVLSSEFSDSSIDYCLGRPGSPLYGWMKQVPAGTPITHSSAPLFDFQKARRTVF